MDRYLRPERFETNPNSALASQQWEHWFKTFENFLSQIEKTTDSDKLRLLTNYVSPSVFEHISTCSTYDIAISILQKIYIKPTNVIFARHKLTNRRQQPNESIDQYLEALKILSKDCSYTAISAEEYRNESIRDSFISGLTSSYIRQRLLEKASHSLDDVYETARSLDLAILHSQEYITSQSAPLVNAIKDTTVTDTQDFHNLQPTLAAVSNKLCFYCGGKWHQRFKCPAKDISCNVCGKKGHYAKVCKSTSSQLNTKTHQNKQLNSATMLNTIYDGPLVATMACLSKATVPISINGIHANALIDTGSTTSFINDKLVQKLKLKIEPMTGNVTMASTVVQSSINGRCFVNIELLNNVYRNVELLVLPDLCANVILGHDLLSQHSTVSLTFGGDKPPLAVCGLAAANVKPASLFTHLSSDCKPITIKSRHHTQENQKFIDDEIKRLLEEDIIEHSSSPWRAQVLVTQSDNHKRRMVIDYSRTINRFTELDAYPIPWIEDVVNKVSSYTVFSAIDLRSAYHQIPIQQSDSHYTAFEASGQLYQFKRIPFGVTNGVAAFQRVIDDIIKSEGLLDTFAYLDDVTVCGKDQIEHDLNLKRFLEAASKYNLTINKEKSSFSMKTIQILGYTISDHTIKPDAERLKPLKSLPPPQDAQSLRRTLGMFSHYSKYIYNFSKKIQPLINCSFPLSSQELDTFEKLKVEIEQASISSIDKDASFTVETDASDFAIAAALSQNGRPVAFFHRTLSSSEQRHSSIEKEAYAIVESLKKWRHYLLGKNFKLVTDQRSVSFMFSNTTSGKIKNEKIARWRLELACFKYDIVYRPGKENTVADAFSRVCLALSTNFEDLKNLHESLCHPGITRLYHWVRSKNLAYSLDDIKRVTASCKACLEVKPRFHKHQGKLIKATSPFERLNLDFKGPLPSKSKNKYLLTVIDEYSRFPFAFPCSDITASTVIANLTDLFSVFGIPAYVHSDRGTSFMSQEVKTFLTSHGIASSRTTPYNPQCNGQTERYNGIIWNTAQLALKSRDFPITSWESVLPDALHSIRSLLCTATNATPHERMFIHPRRTCNGQTLPTWLSKPGPVLLKLNNRQSKYDPLVEEVTLLEANPEYAHVRMPDGRETTVSIRHLAPTAENENDCSLRPEEGEDIVNNSTQSMESPSENHPQDNVLNPSQDVRKSSRQRQIPPYLKDYQL